MISLIMLTKFFLIPGDDIWLLRFILSNKTAKKSVDSVKFAINWRKERKDILDSICAGGEIPKANVWNKFQVAGRHKPAKDGGPTFIIRMGLCNPSALMDNMTHQEVVDYVLCLRELDFRQCDQLTRKHRKLIKFTTINDMKGLKFVMDRRFFKAIGEASKISEKVYPQVRYHYY